MNVTHLKSALAHVLWLGGAIGAGKSSIARLMGEKYSLQVYHYDRLQQEHYARLLPERHATMYAALTMTDEERWVLRSGEAMAESTLAWHAERFEFVIEDLLALPHDQRVLAEGFGLLPHLVAPLLSNSAQALWLISSRAFRRHALTLRGMRDPAAEWPGTSDPQRAQQNKDDRDEILAAAAQREAHELGLSVIEIDGRRSLDEITGLVEQHFAPLLLLDKARGG
ncbi:MAG: hypothetical protein AB7R89_22625 [Dehalococcoidia bacterium]